MLRLSHRLVALHVGGLLLLILVVVAEALWISAEHNRLALRSSEMLVENEIDAIRAEAETLVIDYSIWDRGYASAREDDREWLFRNIGISVTDIGTFDMALLVVPGRGPAFGWVSGSPPEGETGLLPDEILQAALALVADPNGPEADTLVAELDGLPWVFAASRMVPVGGAPSDVASEDLPRQIHGHKLTPARMHEIGEDILAPDLGLSSAAVSGRAALPLIDYRGEVISYVDWEPPRPGASILRKAALPLAIALLVATIISGISSLYAVRSARRLERALHAAKAADRSKAEFLSNVSHELRTPMNGVLGAAQLLATTDLDGEQRELVGVLLSSSTAQMSLISDLIDFSRLDAGSRKIVPEVFEPETVLSQIGDMMQVAASRKGTRLLFRWADLKGLTLRGDARGFRQVVTNLVGNAVKFTDQGSVTVHATAARAEGRVLLTVTVTDTGPGIPESALERIFERFYQVDSSLTRTREGTGLGLAISQKLARAMGGEITVTSRLGEGSSFVFTATLDDAAVPQEARDAA